ncbi:MAG TPA: flagellar hook assembly protein FlgD [Polyangiaceae bacterium]|nr:flagellar hook assembly protein FlgD [Polyangiaceae bacterium]
MATTPVTNASAGSSTALDSLTNAGGTTPLDKTAFLNLLVAQLKNQDPLQPQDDSAFVAQLAQFSQLEQSMQVNTNLQTLSTQMSGLANSQSANLVGSEATVSGNLVTSDGSGLGVQASYSLASAASDVTVTITDQTGTTVRTMDMGAHPAGITSFQWNGQNDAGTVQPAGTYQVSVTAVDASGAPVAVSQQTTGQVTQVSFDKGYPVLNLDNGASVPISDLLKVAMPPNPTTNK